MVGHRDVPGKPALYATSREFLDYFNLQSLEELPTLAELRDIDAINAELEFTMPAEENPPTSDVAANDLELTAEEDSDNAEAELDSKTEAMEEHKSPVAQVENESVIEEPLTAES